MTYHYSDPFCSECDFTIESGWSIRERCCNCICIDCATVFSIEGFSDEYDEIAGEVGHLYQSIIRSQKNRKKHQHKPTKFDTGISVIREISDEKIILDSRRKFTIKKSTFRLEDIACPSCHKLGDLQVSLQVGDNCPQCKIGMMKMLDWQLSG
jgi:hypothetical protein